METYKFRRRILPLCIASVLMAQGGMVLADVQEGLDNLFAEFGDMNNVTNPGAFESSSRGVLSGGRIITKSQQSSIKALGMELPGASAGCGGIDLYGGSFSFINSDQIVQFLRNVAANAKGLAFKLAIDAVSAQMGSVMTEFQKISQLMNDTMLNSCEAAQGIFTIGGELSESLEGGSMKSKTASDLWASGEGFASDFLSAVKGMEFGSNTSLETAKQNDPDAYKDMTGNIVWKQLRINDAASWFPFGDDETLELIMTMSGTVIVGDDPDDPSKPPQVVTIDGNSSILRDLIFAGEKGYNETVTIRSCASDLEQCNSALTRVKTISLPNGGLQKQIKDMLLGANGRVGILKKWATPVVDDSAFTQQEITFMNNMPTALGSTLRNLAQQSPDTAITLAQESSAQIATQMTYDLIAGYLRAAETALGNSENAHAGTAAKIITASKASLYQEYENLIANTGSVLDIVNRYNDIIKNARISRYTQTRGED